MIRGVGNARLVVLASIAFILSFVVLRDAAAAPRAAELGPVVAQAEVRGGFVGRLKVAPEHGPVGTPVTVTGEGLPPGQDFDLAWSTVSGSWKVTTSEYFGRAFTPVAYRIATVKTDASGRFTASFAAPDDFGFLHDIVLQQGDRLLTQNAFNVDMTVKLLSDRGPPGSPIEIEVHGYGYRELEDSWVLLYDNRYTGWMSAVTTAGSARVTIPATGGPGRHVLEVIHSDFTFPYRNKQQSPSPDRPQFKLVYTVTPGPAVLPPAPATQVQAHVERLPDPGELVAVPQFSGVGEPVVVSGNGFPAGKPVALKWWTLTGNRMTGRGWEENARVIAESVPDAAGHVEFRFKAPDDLGGAHGLAAEIRRRDQDRDVLDRADGVSPRRRPRSGRHDLQGASQGRRVERDRQHLHRRLRQRALRLRLRLQQPGRRRDHHAGDRRAGLAFHRSLPRDLQGQGDAADQLPPAPAHRRARPSGRRLACIPLRLRGDARSAGRHFGVSARAIA